MNITHPFANPMPWRLRGTACLVALMAISGQTAQATQVEGANIGRTISSTPSTTIPGGTARPAKSASAKKSASSASASR